MVHRKNLFQTHRENGITIRKFEVGRELAPAETKEPGGFAPFVKGGEGHEVAGGFFSG